MTDQAIIDGFAHIEATTDIFAQLTELIGEDASVIKDFALDHVPVIAEFPRVERSKFYERLYELKISKTWVRRELSPAVNEAAKQAKEDDDEQYGFVLPHRRASTYREALTNMELEFRRNLLNETIEVNDKPLDDFREAEILSDLTEVGLCNQNIAKISWSVLANHNSFHPIHDYFESLVWDGKDHISKLCSYVEDEHNPIVYEDGSERSVFSVYFYKFLIGAVGKVYDSKANQNPMLVLDGGQGLGKSQLVSWLCPEPKWHYEGSIRPDDKDYVRYLSHTLLWEASELGGIVRKSDFESLKAFLTKHDVKMRPAYGRHDIDKPAITSFIGTINSVNGFLNDPTGHRRFRPVTIAAIDWAYSEAIDVDQLWAQAYYLYQQGETWQLCEEERLVHAEICSNYEYDDPMETWVRGIFKIEPENSGMFTSFADIIDAIASQKGIGNTSSLQRTLPGTLKRLGLSRARGKGEGRPRGYRGIEKRMIHDPADPHFS